MLFRSKAGSDLLVEIAKKVALSVWEQKGVLIFPAVTMDENDSPKLVEGQPVIPDGPNKILAIVAEEPGEIAQKAQKVAVAHLKEEWDKAQVGMTSVQKKGLDTSLANRQVETFLEFYAAWLPLQNYKEDRKQVDRLLAGRKALREFSPSPCKPCRPKSPLDPSRDCVLNLHEANKIPEGCEQSPLWLKSSEVLDAISILKRVKGVKISKSVPSTPSTSEMAFRAILPEIKRKEAENEKVRKAMIELRRIANLGGAGVDVSDLFFENRVEELKTEQQSISEADWNQVANYRRDVLKGIGRAECPPYYAILVADGDKMGALLNEMNSKEEHQEFSCKLSKFAKDAGKIVQEAKGHLVYSGGDDVVKGAAFFS